MKCINLFLIFFVLLTSCKEEQKEDYLNPTKHFSIPTEIRKWKNYNEIAINDSLKKVVGDFNQYKIEGFINNKNQKVNWWKIVNTKENDEDNVRIEYRIIDNKEEVNQFIFYHNGNDYVKNSQFYLREKLNNSKNTYKYSFYTPNKYPKKNLLKKFEYFLYINNKEVKNVDLDCMEDDSRFFVNITTPDSNQEIIVKGLFTELFEDNNKKSGQNEIYVLDTIRVKVQK